MKLIQLALKVLFKFRLYFTINLLGLVLSLACGMILIRYIHQELMVDHYAQDLDRLYVYVREYPDKPTVITGGFGREDEPEFLRPQNALVEPEIEMHASYFSSPELFVTVGERDYIINTMLGADNRFLEIFPHPLKAGRLEFRSPFEVILTEKLAKRFFGNDNPVGQSIIYANGDVYTVIGVIGEPATKSTIVFDMLTSLDYRKRWHNQYYHIIKLYPGTDIEALNEKYSKLKPPGYETIGGAVPTYKIKVFPFKDLYMDNTVSLQKQYVGKIYQKGNPQSIAVLSVVAVLLLCIGFFNYTNIYTLLMLNRAREFGVKKVYGASPKAVFMQIWVENLFVTVLTLLFVWAIIELTGGLMQSLFTVQVKTNAVFDFWLSVIVLFVFSLLVSIHPTVRYNTAPPITSLRSVNMAGKSVLSRTVFLSLQYIVTFFILLLSLFFMKQLHYMLHADLGYQTSNIIKFSFISSPIISGKIEGEQAIRHQKDQYNIKLVEQKLDESPLFRNWSKGRFPHEYTSVATYYKEGGEPQQVIFFPMFREYMDMLDLELVEGRLWEQESDKAGDPKVIINETAKKLFGIEDISKEYIIDNTYSRDTTHKARSSREIVGVIKDFNAYHLSKSNPPMVIRPNSKQVWWFDTFVAQITPGKETEAIQYLKNLYAELAGSDDFKYSFLEDEIAALYESDKLVSRIYALFAIIAILISCLGLYGLSLFDIRQRYREIALRKVNGASAGDILRLLQRKYAYILAGSFLVAVPVSYFAIKKYLEGFAHQAPISWWLFAIAGVFVAGISFLTLNIQIRKAMRVNPAEVLKGE